MRPPSSNSPTPTKVRPGTDPALPQAAGRRLSTPQACSAQEPGCSDQSRASDAARKSQPRPAINPDTVSRRRRVDRPRRAPRAPFRGRRVGAGRPGRPLLSLRRRGGRRSRPAGWRLPRIWSTSTRVRVPSISISGRKTAAWALVEVGATISSSFTALTSARSAGSLRSRSAPRAACAYSRAVY
jgi:hypothetical protein